MKSRKKSDPQNKASKRFLFDDHYIDSHNLSTWLCINVVRRKLMLVTDLRVEKFEALLVCDLLERKYYCMRNFYYLIGLQRWYFSSIWNTYVWKLQLTFAVSSINKYGHDFSVRDIWHKYHSWYFKIVSVVTYSNFEISLVEFMPDITTNHAITYTNRWNKCL